MRPEENMEYTKRGIWKMGSVNDKEYRKDGVFYIL